MKKYVVLHKIGDFPAKEERQFDNIDDARMFRNLLETSKTADFHEYYIAEIIE